MLFSFAGCDGNIEVNLSNQQQYELAQEKIDNSVTAIKTQAVSAKDLFAIKVSVNGEVNFTSDIITAKLAADGKVQVKFDFDDISKSKLLTEFTIVHPDKLGASVTEEIGMYYTDNYLYNNIKGDKTKNPVPFEMLGEITAGENYIQKLMDLAKTFFTQKIGEMKNLTDVISLIPQKEQSPMTILFLDELNKSESKPYEIFNFTVTDSQIKIELNYPAIKNILNTSLDAYKIKLQDILAKQDFKAAITQDERFADYININALSNLIYNSSNEDLTSALTAVFKNIQNMDFLNFIDYAANKNGSFITSLEGAASLFKGDYESASLAAEWIYNNKLQEFLSFTNGDIIFQSIYADNVNYNIDSIKTDMQEGLDSIDIIKQNMPAEFVFKITVDFNSNGLFKEISIYADSSFKIPSDIFSEEAENKESEPALINAALKIDLKISLETDPAKILFEFPSFADYNNNMTE